MKKGFTFIELAIILVIIGIIAGLGIKISSIIETARVQQDLKRISKMRDSVSILMSNVSPYDGIEALRYLQNNIDLDMSQFAQANLLLQEDLTIGQTAYSWRMLRCSLTGNPNDTDRKYAGNANGINICAFAEALSPALLCHIENLMDDQNPVTGSGRLAAGNKNFNFPECSRENKTPDTNLRYFFRLY